MQLLKKIIYLVNQYVLLKIWDNFYPKKEASNKKNTKERKKNSQDTKSIPVSPAGDFLEPPSRPPSVQHDYWPDSPCSTNSDHSGPKFSLQMPLILPKKSFSLPSPSISPSSASASPFVSPVNMSASSAGSHHVPTSAIHRDPRIARRNSTENKFRERPTRPPSVGQNYWPDSPYSTSSDRSDSNLSGQMPPRVHGNSFSFPSPSVSPINGPASVFVSPGKLSTTSSVSPASGQHRSSTPVINTNCTRIADSNLENKM